MKQTISLILFVLSAVILLAFPASQTGSVTVSWTPGYDTNYLNQSYFSEFIVYSSTTTNITANGTPYPTSITNLNLAVSGLTRGATYYFTVTQVATNGAESDYGPIVPYTVPNKPPKVGTVNVN